MAYVNDCKEVLYGEYCHKCVHADKSEQEDPCFECMAEPTNLWSHKPVKFEPKEDSNANG